MKRKRSMMIVIAINLSMETFKIVNWIKNKVNLKCQCQFIQMISEHNYK